MHAIEPLQTTLDLLHDTLRINGVEGHVAVHPIGLGAATGRFVVYTFAGLPHGHASAVDLGRADASPHMCELRTLDELVEAAAIGRVDFLKVDVEGLESDVFEGGRTVLGQPDAPIVAFETNVQCLAARGMRCLEVQDRLRALGYERFARIRPDGRLEPVTGDLGEGNGDYIAGKASRYARLAHAGLA